MKTPEIRKTFLEFFEDRAHRLVPSSSLVPDDPTLLLTNAGMVQFKPYFLGEKPAPFKRAASVQKCFREIDLEEVGKTARHLTFFEMLGNFSFGDYFKLDACRWAWELMVAGFGLDPARLWVTVYVDDDETAKIWQDEVGVAGERILRRTRKEGNFWDMGVAGPCGPCSELLYDRGEKFGTGYAHGGDLDEERYLEVWNLVFMQHMQDDKGQIVGDLPTQNVDTGMGLERLAAILQDVASNFEIDSMAPILRIAEQATGKTYGESTQSDVGLRVVSEHSRSIAFLIADGVFPGNVGRGYVLRRLMRRALRHALLLGVEDPLLGKLTGAAIEIYSGDYPEIAKARDLITAVVKKEEDRFELTHRQGLAVLEQEIAGVKAAGAGEIPGDVVFRLHDTYGFPLDLTVDVAADEGLEVDQKGFELLMRGQRERARSARHGGAKGGPAEMALSEALENFGPTEFKGYEDLSLDSEVAGLIQGVESATVLEQGAKGQVILLQTPFYCEGGGQVGDRGEIRTGTGTFRVDRTYWGTPAVAVHSGKVTAGEIQIGQDARATVDREHRDGVTKSHTATHMVHWALRDSLGDHARQKGSLVEPGRFHFDFSHFEGISDDRLAEMEQEVNKRARWDDSVRAFETTREYATSMGAMALFGEKYGDFVRVVEVGDYSKELCGGTHVARTGQIGVIKLVREGSVAAGVRRVEALTGGAGLAYLNDQAARLQQVAAMLKSDPDRVVERLEKTLAQVRDLESELADHRAKQQTAEITALLESESVVMVGGIKVAVVERTAASPDELRKFAVALRDQLGSGVAVAGGAAEGKASIAAAVTRDLTDKLSAQEIIELVKPILGGGGGGKPDLAVAGGPNHQALGAALQAAREFVDNHSRAQ